MKKREILKALWELSREKRELLRIREDADRALFTVERAQGELIRGLFRRTLGKET